VLLAVLVGNTTLRYGLVQEGAVLGRAAVTIPRDGSPLPGGWAPRGTFDAAVVGSVNPPRLEEALRGLEGLGAPVLVAGRDVSIPIPNRYRDPAEVGSDRLLNALAASVIWPRRGAVVLDFGTALSVSVASPDGEFLGGPIAGGVAAIGGGLALRAARLADVRPDRLPQRVLAASTREALQAGIFWQIAGGASRILEALAAELTFPFGVVATGGDAELFAPAIPRVELVDGDLALKGLALTYSRGRKGP
jgi:type III pantothenate kinase